VPESADDQCSQWVSETFLQSLQLVELNNESMDISWIFPTELGNVPLIPQFPFVIHAFKPLSAPIDCGKVAEIRQSDKSMIFCFNAGAETGGILPLILDFHTASCTRLVLNSVCEDRVPLRSELVIIQVHVNVVQYALFRGNTTSSDGTVPLTLLPLPKGGPLMSRLAIGLSTKAGTVPLKEDGQKTA